MLFDLLLDIYFALSFAFGINMLTFGIKGFWNYDNLSSDQRRATLFNYFVTIVGIIGISSGLHLFDK